MAAPGEEPLISAPECQSPAQRIRSSMQGMEPRLSSELGAELFGDEELAIVSRDSFCIEEARRTCNLAVQQEAKEKGALVMMNDCGEMRMVEPMHSSQVRDAVPGTMANGGNTCYISAVIFALFARLDVWDVLLVHQLASPLASRLQDHLRVRCR